LVVAVWMLVLWLSRRGKFMFLHCVALDKAEVVEPWSKFAGAANSLFRFRILMGLIGMVLLLPLLAFIALAILRMVLQGGPDVTGVMTAVVLGLMFMFVAVLLAVIHKFMVDFVVPIMFLRRNKCWDAWKELLGLVSAHLGVFVLYILFQIVMGMAIGALIIMAVLVTCCIAGCLMALPFLGTVLLLPVLVFKRSYSLSFLAQFGPEYNVFPPAPPTRPSPGLPPMPVAPPAM